jgi:hypothetical protein
MAEKFNKNDYEKELDLKSEQMSKKDQDALEYFKNRFSAMDNDRTDYEEEWKTAELQVQAEVPYRDDGKASVNVPMEQNTIEQKN